MKTRDFCVCGAQLTLRGPDRDQPKIQAARRIFLSTHQGEGHGPCDAKTALRVRLRAEAASRASGAGQAGG